MRSQRVGVVVLGAALLALTLAGDAAAQRRRGPRLPRSPRGRGGYVAPFYRRALPEFGLRGGYDFDSGSGSLGTDLRLPLGRRGLVALAPSADIFFNEPGHDWQVNLDGELRAPRSGLYGGGGAALIHRFFLPSERFPGPDVEVAERSTKVGWNLFAGLEPMMPLPLRPYVETRWTFHGEDYSAFRLVGGVHVPIGQRARAYRER